VFDNANSAQTAIEEIQGFELFEKPLILDFARSKSDATIQRTGSDTDLEAHKRRRLAEKGKLSSSIRLTRFAQANVLQSASKPPLPPKRRRRSDPPMQPLKAHVRSNRRGALV
jgi:RNA recognition motif-containing protein